MNREHDRDDYRLRLLIEQLVRAGSSEAEIEAAVYEAAGQARRASRRPGRLARAAGALRR